jgi:hypothetical protein
MQKKHFIFQNPYRLFKMRAFLLIALALTALVVLSSAKSARQDDSNGDDSDAARVDNDVTRDADDVTRDADDVTRDDDDVTRDDDDVTRDDDDVTRDDDDVTRDDDRSGEGEDRELFQIMRDTFPTSTHLALNILFFKLIFLNEFKFSTVKHI